ncbi:Sporulation kinase D [compost metagenome]
MTESQQQSLFKPFCTSKQGGLGVGLVMVKRIMERFGARISVFSQLNSGTEVRMTFRTAKRK